MLAVDFSILNLECTVTSNFTSLTQLVVFSFYLHVNPKKQQQKSNRKENDDDDDVQRPASILKSNDDGDDDDDDGDKFDTSNKEQHPITEITAEMTDHQSQHSNPPPPPLPVADKRASAQIDTIFTKHRSKKKRIQLLHEMNLMFPEGSVTVILGPSGSGRSILLHALTDSLPVNLIGVGSGKYDYFLFKLLEKVWLALLCFANPSMLDREASTTSHTSKQAPKNNITYSNMMMVKHLGAQRGWLLYSRQHTISRCCLLHSWI